MVVYIILLLPHFVLVYRFLTLTNTLVFGPLSSSFYHPDVAMARDDQTITDVPEAIDHLDIGHVCVLELQKLLVL